MNKPKVTMTTYRRQDCDLIDGEFAFVTAPSYFDDVEQPVKIIQEVWVRQSVKVVKFKPRRVLKR